eukprot:998717-Pleurochrysis_carterae.AAC.5
MRAGAHAHRLSRERAHSRSRRAGVPDSTLQRPPTPSVGRAHAELHAPHLLRALCCARAPSVEQARSRAHAQPLSVKHADLETDMASMHSARGVMDR